MSQSLNAKKFVQKLVSLDRSDVLAFFICAGMFFFWLNILIVKFIDFGYYDWDLAMYAQATWALSHGSLHSSLFATNFLTNHAEYISFFIAPFYRLFPSAFTLVVFKTLSFVGGSFIFYLITKKLLGWRLGLLFMVLYQLHPANAFMMIYEFHFENLAIVLIFLMYYFFLEERIIPFLITAFFATIVKENISLVVFMFAIIALFTPRKNKPAWIIGPTIIGGVFFILTMFFITPHLRAQEGIVSTNQYISMYWHASEHAIPVSQSLWKNFLSLWQTFISPLNQNYMTALFSPFHILPFLSPLTLLLGATIFLQHFLAPSFTMHTLYYHYAATAVIFIFLATVQSFTKIKKHVRSFFYFFLICTTVFAYGLYIRNYLPEFNKRLAYWHDRLDPVRQNMLEQVPQKASIVASFDFLDRLANRPELFSLHNIWQNYATFTGKTPFTLPPNLSYALIDWSCPWLWSDLLHSSDEKTHDYLTSIHNLYFSHPWHVVDAVEEITLLSTQKSNEQLASIVINSQSPFPDLDPTHKPLAIGDHLKLIYFATKPSPTKTPDLLPLEFVWQMKKTTKHFFAIDLKVFKNDRVVLEKIHHIGYAFNATPLWEEGQYVKEKYNLLISSLTPGKYSLNISIFNVSTKEYEIIFDKGHEFNNFDILDFVR